ncbi:MAG TPA: PQQ-binding-like beta-propeller repeat protein [Pyrinomonadaceae bacterium]
MERRLRAAAFSALVMLCVFGFVDATGQGDVESTSSKLTYKKCWESPVEVLPVSGVTADNEHGYFVDRSGKLVALDLESGRIAWTAETGGMVRSDVIVSNGRALAVASPVWDGILANPILRSFSSKTGLPRWNLELPRAEKYYLMVAGEGIAAVSDSGDLWLIDTADGRIEWHARARGRISSEPRIKENRVLLAIDGKNVQEFSLENGTSVSFVKVEGNPAFVGAGKSSAAVYSDERGNVHSINMSGGRNWKFRVGGRVVYVRPVEGNVLLGSADNFVYFMSVEYGNLLWKRRLPGRIASGGLIGEGLAVFTVIGERSAFVLELEKGRIVDRLELGVDDAFLLTPIQANGKYLLAATANGLSAFSTACASN